MTEERVDLASDVSNFSVFQFSNCITINYSVHTVASDATEVFSNMEKLAMMWVLTLTRIEQMAKQRSNNHCYTLRH